MSDSSFCFDVFSLTGFSGAMGGPFIIDEVLEGPGSSAERSSTRASSRRVPPGGPGRRIACGEKGGGAPGDI